VTSKINNHERNNQYKKLFPNFSLFLFAMLILNLHKFQEWKNIQIALGKLGKEAIKRKIQELKVDEIPVDVALGARDLIRDFTLDQVRMVSAGGATFFVWVSPYLSEDFFHLNMEICQLY
jgi:hypothetical protein